LTREMDIEESAEVDEAANAEPAKKSQT